MARPKPLIITSTTFDNAVWDILEVESQYTILYKGRPVSVRKEFNWAKPGFKYMKSTYPHEGSVIAQCRKLNQVFNTNDFTYTKTA